MRHAPLEIAAIPAAIPAAMPPANHHYLGKGRAHVIPSRGYDVVRALASQDCSVAVL
jgi:hypothetical protein